MRYTLLFILSVALMISCGESGGDRGTRHLSGEQAAESIREVSGRPPAAGGESLLPGTIPEGAVLIASDIVTEVIINPDPDGDPWQVEKVAGYDGDLFVDNIFSRIYDGTLTAWEYHSGEPLTPADIKKMEQEFNNERDKIGKLSFTEEWYYYPSANRLEKKIRSVTFGYELYNNQGKVYAYRAAFRVDLN